MAIFVLIAYLVFAYLCWKEGVRRSRDSLAAGVCTGIARRLGVPAPLVQILFFFTGSLVLYVILALVLKEE